MMEFHTRPPRLGGGINHEGKASDGTLEVEKVILDERRKHWRGRLGAGFESFG